MVTAPVKRRRPLQGALCCVSVASLLALAACAQVPRREAPPSLLTTATPVGFTADVRLLSTDRASVETRSTTDLPRLRRVSKDGTVRALVLSGGGAGGAFGAGALIGLSRRHERPEYQVVTGVSAGALIAPFAFLGPAWDPQLRQAFTSGQGGKMSLHGLLSLSFAAARRSALLKSLVDRYITADLIKAIAREAASGRILWVATTDLDKEETVIWDMGAIARRGGEPARELFRDVLVASASIPGVFEPVLIRVQEGGVLYDEMHVDGGVSAPLFVAPAAASFALLDQQGLAGAEVYVLINGRLISAPQTTRFQSGAIVRRSVATAIRSMARAQAIAVDQFAEKYRMSLRSTYLPFDYPVYNPGDFRAAVMRPLFDYGERCAESGRLWTTAEETIANVSTAARSLNPTPPTEQETACPARALGYSTAVGP